MGLAPAMGLAAPVASRLVMVRKTLGRGLSDRGPARSNIKRRALL